jgi:glycosyltransferase involved in cell wall biosynthesis
MVDVSVLTPSYQYGRFIEDAIQSVLRQSGLSVQLVIQDGGSSDETQEILSRYEHLVDSISEPDRGQSDALNRALSRATAHWVAWLNADEFYLPGSLAHLVRIGQRYGADVVYGECVIVDEAGRLVQLLPEHRFNARILKDFGCYISSSSTIFRRSTLGEAPWDEKITRIMDWDLFMNLAARDASFVFTAHPISAFRIHGEQVTAAPHHHFDEENAIVTARHGRPADPVKRWKASRVGRWMHPFYKLLDGAYLREWQARPLRGTDLRWFRPEVGEHSVNSLLENSYARRGPH